MLAGIVSAPRTDFKPVTTDQPAQQPPSQRGALGGRAAVARMFGLTDAGELPPIEGPLSRPSTLAGELDCTDVLSAGVDSLMHECVGSGAEPAVTGKALTIRIPGSTGPELATQGRLDATTGDVSLDIESLLTASLDSMLFGTDDSTMNEVSMLETALARNGLFMRTLCGLCRLSKDQSLIWCIPPAVRCLGCSSRCVASERSTTCKVGTACFHQ